MSKINLKYNDEDYTLEFTRNTVRQMERGGFVASDLANKPLTMIEKLVEGAFMKHHPKLDKKECMKIYEAQTHKNALFAALAEMYQETMEALIDVEEDSDEGNPTWTRA